MPKDFERRLAGPRAPWQLGESDQTACIRVPRHVFDAARASYGGAVSLQEENGSAVLVTRYTGERQLAGWILSLDPNEYTARNLALRRVVGMGMPDGPGSGFLCLCADGDTIQLVGI